MNTSMAKAENFLASRMEAAAGGDAAARYELGLAYSSGASGLPINMIAAHKWFNLAALAGFEEGAERRAAIAEEMTAREIADAQREARDWLRRTNGLAGLRAAA